MSLFKKSFKLSQLKNNRWHVVEIGNSAIYTFNKLEDAFAFIKKESKNEEKA